MNSDSRNSQVLPIGTHAKGGNTSKVPAKIRVLHIALQIETGGMEKLLVEFARCANRNQYDLRFLSIERCRSIADEILAQGWPIETLAERPGLRPRLVLRLAKIFREVRPDIVHTHNTKPLIYAGPAARMAGVRRIVHTRHGQRFGASRSETTLFRLASYTADRIVTVSHDSARLSRDEGIASNKITTIWNGINVERFNYLGPQIAGPAIMVGRLSPEKDVESLIRAVAIITREEPSFRLQIAGDGERMPDLRRLAADLGVEGAVRFLGEVQDIPALLARASLFVLSSLTEGISLTLLEAMARGLPVVATRVGGNTEVVSEGQTGLLVSAQSPPELAAAMLSLYRDPAARRSMGKAGRSRVELHFEVRRMVAEYERLYLRLLDPGPSQDDGDADEAEEPAPNTDGAGSAAGTSLCSSEVP